ncbi:hypothetical protein FRB94_010661 [Tulasnella sp. JGI-2019a]|nr:hypothetical protein FRB94_010661 [Tulasnella sp. JGI-2019a]KAG9011316.1 hypothetical protein FRB93_003118 [Tulasnella sp. JGI-2019a]
MFATATSTSLSYLSFSLMPSSTTGASGKAPSCKPNSDPITVSTITPPCTPPSEPSWTAIAAGKQADRERQLAKWSHWRLGDRLPSPDVDDVSEIVLCNLNSREREIVQSDATDILRRIRTRELTAVEVLTAFCKVTIPAQETLNCVTEIFFEQGFERAAQLDKHLEETGEVVGPLHGLPVSIKDHILVKGLDTSTGYISWANKTVATKDAVAVDILRKAGAVLYVKTANPQTLLCLETNNNIYGRTLNPFNRKLSPGGSSGGESALIAARGSPMGIGTDIGGSIRIPAAYTGLYGFKPSVARMPHAGLMGSHDGMDNIIGVVGPMVHSARDLELFCRVMLQYEAWLLEHAVLEMPWRKEIVEGQTLPKKLCYAMLWDDGVVKPHPPLLREMRRVKAALEAAGHEVIDWVPLEHQKGWDLIVKLYLLDAAEEYWATLAESGEPAVPGTTWMMSHCSQGQQPCTVPETWKLNLEREAFRARGLVHWNSTVSRTSTGRPVDAIICPTAPNLAVPHDKTHWWGYSSHWNMLDLPGVVFPIGGRYDPSSAAPDSDDVQTTPRNDVEKHYVDMWTSGGERFKGAPITLQLIGRRHNEEKVLAMLNVVEEAVKAM